MTHARTHSLLPLVLAAMLAVASSVSAQERRVVLVDVDARVADAIAVALSPYELDVARAAGPAPDREMTAATEGARRIAADKRAGAVVWITPRHGDERASLWLYDAQTQQMTVRPLNASPPFDEAGAAAVALSVKTILRASPLVAEATASTSATAAAPSASASAPTAVRTPAPSGASAAQPPAPLPPPPPSSPSLRLEALAGARAPTGADSAIEPRLGLGASWWPAALEGHFGLGASVQGGTSVALDAPAFTGSFAQWAFDPSVRARALPARWLAFEAQAGLVFALTSIDGDLLPARAHLRVWRVNPAFAIGGAIDLSLGARVSVGPFASGSAFLRTQTYSAGPDQVVLSEPVFGAAFGARVCAGVD